MASLVHADLVVVNTGDNLDGYVDASDANSDDIADGGIASLTHTESFDIAGVMFDLSFDLLAGGGFFNGRADDMGIWSNTDTESPSRQNAFLAPRNETIELRNVAISNVSGGTAVFNGITSVGLDSAAGADDEGEFVIPGNVISWTSSSPFFVGGDLDGTASGDRTFDLLGGNGGTPVSGFLLRTVGANLDNSFRLDAVEFDVAVTAVPDASSLVLFACGAAGVGARLRRRRRAV